MIISQTPFRLSLFGGGSDFPDWFETEKGQVVSGAIDKFAYISLRRLPPFFDHKIRAAYSIIETVNSSDELTHPAMKAILSHYLPEEGVEVSYQGDLPAQSGVGTSSSFTVGLLAAVKKLTGATSSREELARDAVWVEQDLLRENVGLQDQIAAAYGGLNHIEFGPARDAFTVRSIGNSDVLARRLQDCLVMVFSGKQRFSSEIHGGMGALSPHARQALRRTVGLVDDFLSLAENPGRPGEFPRILAELLDESWALKIAVNPNTVTPEILDLRDALKKNGALGVKILGAGGGGFLLASVPQGEKDDFILRTNGHSGKHAVPFRFVDVGAQILHHSS